MIDPKAETKWNKSRKSYKNYQDYIARKEQRFSLTLIDLLFISNFKGGNGSIHEEEPSVNTKLVHYSMSLSQIQERFQQKNIATLTDKELDQLILQVISICNLTNSGCDTKIDGFGPSYLSAMLNAYFPELIPILDRRVLLNSGLAGDQDLDRQKQIIEIENFYPKLIKEVADTAKRSGKALWEIDKMLFSEKIPCFSPLIDFTRKKDTTSRD